MLDIQNAELNKYKHLLSIYSGLLPRPRQQGLTPGCSSRVSPVTTGRRRQTIRSRVMRMWGLRAAAYSLPLLSGLAVGALRIADWAFLASVPRDAAPSFWRMIDWLLFPFAMAGLPLLAPTVWVWSRVSSLLSGLIGGEATHSGAAFVIAPCLLFTLYLLVRGRSIVADDLLRASGAGSLILILIGLLSTFSLKGSSDAQASVSMVMGQNGGLIAAVLVAEWVLRQVRVRPAD